VPPYAIFKLALALPSGLLSLHSALAAEPKPDVTVKTKAIEARNSAHFLAHLEAGLRAPLMRSSPQDELHVRL
jgi:hypothetical protein